MTMKDTDLHKSNEPAVHSSKPLDVDRFFHGFVVPPQPRGRHEGTLLPGPDGRIYFSNYEVEYLGKREDDFMYATMRESTDNGRTWSAPRDCLNKHNGKVKASHITILRLNAK